MDLFREGQETGADEITQREDVNEQESSFSSEGEKEYYPMNFNYEIGKDLEEYPTQRRNITDCFNLSGGNCSSKSSDHNSSERESSLNSPDCGSSYNNKVNDNDNYSSFNDVSKRESPTVAEKDYIFWQNRIKTLSKSKITEGNMVESDNADVPNPGILRRIASLLEYYLSDENLAKDTFLLKRVAKHREGYVSLKLLSNYKKVKKMTSDWRHVKLALEESKTLEMNEDETKVRRKGFMPSVLGINTRPFRCILAYDIPIENSSMDKLAGFFGAFGEMNSLQIHKPGGRIIQEIQILIKDKPEIANSVCAVVEYEKENSARLALKTMMNNNRDSGMKVIPAIHQSKDVKANGGRTFLRGYESSYFSASELDEPFSSPSGRRKLMARSSSSSLMSSPCISPFSTRRSFKTVYPLESSSGSQVKNWRDRNVSQSPTEDLKLLSSQTSSDYFSSEKSNFWITRSSPFHIRTPPPKSPSISQLRKTVIDNSQASWSNSSSTPSSPWVNRRRVMGVNDKLCDGHIRNESSDPNTTKTSPLRCRSDYLKFVKIFPQTITRLPKGPDGTSGFYDRNIVRVA